MPIGGSRLSSLVATENCTMTTLTVRTGAASYRAGHE